MCGFRVEEKKKNQKLLKQCDYDKSAQFACDTQRRMNGHVKSMCCPRFMELATSKFLLYLGFFYLNEKKL